MKNKNRKFIKIGKIAILVFCILTIFNIVLLINNNSYAFFKKEVISDKRIVEIHTANEFLGKTGVDTLKTTLGQEGGIIGITENNALTTNKNDDIREYRYSGLDVNNYVYFNCKDNIDEQSAENCELWRIIGVFKDRGYNKIKIVRDNVLTLDQFPTNYTVEDTTYKIKSTTANSNGAFWKNVNPSNDWSTAGIQYWLNSQGTGDKGYLRYLYYNAQNMISDTKYYLGNVKYATTFIDDTPVSAYANERAVTGCTDNKGPTTNDSRTNVENNENCLVYANNAATWTGKIALMYPSDYGFSADSQYWNTKLGKDSFNGEPSSSSWFQKSSNVSTHEWFLNGNTGGAGFVSYLNSEGRITTQKSTAALPLRPTLYLKSDVLIDGGSGTKLDPYKLDNVYLMLNNENSKIPTNRKVTFTATTNVEGNFDVTSDRVDVAIIETSLDESKKVLTISVTGQIEGETNIKVVFTPTDKNYKKQIANYKLVVSNGELATTKIKSQIGKGGLIGVVGTDENISSVKTAEGNEIREYRYSGADVDNYVYFNCKDEIDQNSTNCETWRIIGVFDTEIEDIPESGSTSTKTVLKLVRSDYLQKTEFPESYTVNNIKYTLQDTMGIYWNNKPTSPNSDWTTAGLKYWLNSESTTDSDSGYLETLSMNAQKMIASAKYYLGNVIVETDTPALSYVHERGSLACNSAITTSTSCSGGDVWSSNKEMWIGKIGLMYPSDYGFSTDSQYWKISMKKFSEQAEFTSPWTLDKKMAFISPTAERYMYTVGIISGSNITTTYCNTVPYNIRPVLYLRDDINIFDGDGTEKNPYKLLDLKN